MLEELLLTVEACILSIQSCLMHCCGMGAASQVSQCVTSVCENQAQHSVLQQRGGAGGALAWHFSRPSICPASTLGPARQHCQSPSDLSDRCQYMQQYVPALPVPMAPPSPVSFPGAPQARSRTCC